MNRLELAKQFSHDAHDSIQQVRKYSGKPYWVHTDEVADIVASVGGTEDMVIAAYLHDVLEDVTPKNPSYNELVIIREFGVTVAGMVVDLTDVYTKAAYPKDNRAKRHEMENLRIAGIRPDSKTIKLADIISNTKSIVAEDKDFAHVYLREVLELLGHLTDGNASLLNTASWAIVDGLKQIDLPITMIVP